jgi:PAS domain S-box-containing protein
VPEQASERLRQLTEQLANLEQILGQTRQEIRELSLADQTPQIETVAPVGLWWGDLGAGTFTGSENALRLFGLPPGDHPPEAWLEHIHPEDRESVAAYLTPSDGRMSHANRGFGLRFRLESRPQSLTTTWVEARGQIGPGIMRGEGPGPRILAALWPLLTPPQSPEANDELAQLYLALSGTMRDYVQLASIDRKTMFVSPSFYAISGYRPEELSQTDFSSRIHPEDLARVERARRANLAGRTTRVEWRLKHREGNYRWMETIASPRRGAQGDVEAIACYTRDINARKHAESQLRQARREALAASQAKDSFVGHVSHELRTPISVILGSADLGLIDESDPGRRETLTTIKSSAERLIALVDDLLDLNRIQAGKFHLTIRPFLLHERLAGIVRTAELLAQTKKIELSLDVRSNVPEEAWSDPDRLEQVLLNLLGNAVKFTQHKGRITLRVRGDHDSSGARCLRFEVEDTGYGIPKEKMEKIFLPFERHIEPGQPVAEGSGLGLPIAAQIVELMGGRLEADSEVGQGSVFWFRIPIDPPTSSPSLDGSSVSEGSISEDRWQILVIEEDGEPPSAASDVVRQLGYPTRRVHDTASAIAAISEHNYDLILLDLELPGLDCYQAARDVVVACEQQSQSARIVGLAADDDPALRGECLSAGMIELLIKPVTPERLTDLIVDLQAGD